MAKTDSVEATTIWGISVTSTNGRRAWPEAIKQQALKRVRGGETVVAVSKEIGANESVLHRWLSQSRAAAAPEFVEVSPPAVPAMVPRASEPEETEECVLKIGDISITIRPGYPLDHLQLLIKAVRGSM